MEIPSFLTDYVDYLRNLSYDNSDERLHFTKNKLLAHRQFMEGLRRFDPYLHPDEWEKEKVEVHEL
jgi:hypothetical protein